MRSARATRHEVTPRRWSAIWPRVQLNLLAPTCSFETSACTAAVDRPMRQRPLALKRLEPSRRNVRYSAASFTLLRHDRAGLPFCVRRSAPGTLGPGEARGRPGATSAAAARLPIRRRLSRSLAGARLLPCGDSTRHCKVVVEIGVWRGAPSRTGAAWRSRGLRGRVLHRLASFPSVPMSRPHPHGRAGEKKPCCSPHAL